MKFLLFVGSICTMVYGASASCHSTNTNGGDCKEAADLPQWMTDHYSHGDTCFDFNDGKWCFMNGGGSMEPCECPDDNGGTTTPTTYDNEYCNPSVYGVDNTMCKYPDEGAADACGDVKARGITLQTVKDAIVKKHNDLREKVANGDETQGVGGPEPSAANMLQLVWSDDLAEVAQRWADQCISGHDANRKTATYSNVGQNYAMTASTVASDETDWGKFVQMWYDEVADFPPANVGSFSSDGATGVIGHYTQVVWAETAEVGCGYIYYPDGRWFTKVLMCNYGPAGNFMYSPVYEVGAAGSDCPSGTANKDGLCGKIE